MFLCRWVLMYVCLCVFVRLRIRYCDFCWWNWVDLLSLWLGNGVSVVCISEAEWIWCLCVWVMVFLWFVLMKLSDFMYLSLLFVICDGEINWILDFVYLSLVFFDLYCWNKCFLWMECLDMMLFMWNELMNYVNFVHYVLEDWC